MQSLVDFRRSFMNVCIGLPGKAHDVRVLINSSLYAKTINGRLLPSWNSSLGGVEVPLVVLGDPAYPLLPWLMKPYTGNDHTPADKRYFCYRQSRARIVVENAFWRLKG